VNEIGMIAGEKFSQAQTGENGIQVKESDGIMIERISSGGQTGAGRAAIELVIPLRLAPDG
jgi:hypothetical protein